MPALETVSVAAYVRAKAVRAAWEQEAQLVVVAEARVVKAFNGELRRLLDPELVSALVGEPAEEVLRVVRDHGLFAAQRIEVQDAHALDEGERPLSRCVLRRQPHVLQEASEHRQEPPKTLSGHRCSVAAAAIAVLRPARRPGLVC